MAHPSDAVDLLLVRGLLDPRRMAPRYFILTRAARLSLDSSQALFILRPAIPCPIPQLQHLSSLIRMRLLYPRCRQATMDGGLRHARIRPCPLKAPLKKLLRLFRLARPNPRSRRRRQSRHPSRLHPVQQYVRVTPDRFDAKQCPICHKADFTKLTPFVPAIRNFRPFRNPYPFFLASSPFPLMSP